MKIKIILTIVLLISGCVAPLKPVQRIDFPVTEYEALDKAGTSSVHGQIFLKTRGGDVKYGAGTQVNIMPKTSYSDQWYTQAVKDNFRLVGAQGMEEADHRVLNYIKSTQADGSGNFSFEKLAAGQYYLSGVVSWENSSTVQGAVVTKLIEIKDGEELRVILTY